MPSAIRPLAMLAALTLALAGCGGSDDDSGSEGGDPGGGNERLFSSSGFGEALDAATGRAGDDARVIAIEVTDGGAEFSVLGDDNEAEGLLYTSGDLVATEVAVIGLAPGGEDGFPLSDVDAGAVDAMVAGVAQASEASGLEIVAMSLEPDESGDPRWTITAKGGGGETLTYRAAADGSDLVAADDATRGQAGSEGETGEPVAPGPAQPTPGAPGAPSVADAQAALECVQAAEGDVEQLQECAELVQP